MSSSINQFLFLYLLDEMKLFIIDGLSPSWRVMYVCLLFLLPSITLPSLANVTNCCWPQCLQNNGCCLSSTVTYSSLLQQKTPASARSLRGTPPRQTTTNKTGACLFMSMIHGHRCKCEPHTNSSLHCLADSSAARATLEPTERSAEAALLHIVTA